MSTPTASSAPRRQGIIHLGATSCYVGDNTDIIVMRQASGAGAQKAASACWPSWPASPRSTRTCPALAYTHCQPAQLTTVGKRATLWAERAGDGPARRSTTVWLSCSCAASRAPPAPRLALWSCSRATRIRSRAVEASIAEEMGFDPKPSSRSPARPTAARWTPSSCNALAGIAQSCHEVRHRPAPAGQLQGDGRAVREEPDRFLRHAVQAQPHALRAHLRTGPLRDGGRAEPRLHRRHPVVRAHAGRQRQQARRRGRGASWRRTPS